MNFASMAGGPRGPADLVKANEELETQLFTKSGEVANLRERLAKFERDLTELRAQKAQRAELDELRAAAAAAKAAAAERVAEIEAQLADLAFYVRARGELGAATHDGAGGDLVTVVPEGEPRPPRGGGRASGNRRRSRGRR